MLKKIKYLQNIFPKSSDRVFVSLFVSLHSDGVGRSGCLSAIMSLIDRVKTEQTVDVFQTVKLIRARRPGAVDTLVS